MTNAYSPLYIIFILFFMISSCRKVQVKCKTFPYTTNICVKFINSKINEGETFYLKKEQLDFSVITIDSSKKMNNQLVFKTKTNENFKGIITYKSDNSPAFIVTNEPIELLWNDWNKETKLKTVITGGENSFFYENNLKFSIPFDKAFEINSEISDYGFVNKEKNNFKFSTTYNDKFYNWINDNRDKYCPILDLYYYRESLSNYTLEKCLNTLYENHRDTNEYKAIEAHLKSRKKNHIGEKFVDFIVIDKNNKTLQCEFIFKKNKEKYIVDFGASWCRYCIVQARKINNKYSQIDTSKVQIISISIDKKREDWLLYTKKENYKWSGYMINEKDTTIRPIISLIPYYYVLDKNKKIIGKYKNLESIPFLKFK